MNEQRPRTTGAPPTNDHQHPQRTWIDECRQANRGLGGDAA